MYEHILKNVHMFAPIVIKPFLDQITLLSKFSLLQILETSLTGVDTAGLMKLQPTVKQSHWPAKMI